MLAFAASSAAFFPDASQLCLAPVRVSGDTCSGRFLTNDQLCRLVEAIAGHRDRKAFASLFEYFAPRLKSYGSGDAETQRLIPLPLRHHLGSSLDRLAWRRVGPLLQEFRLPLRSENIRASLLKVRRGAHLPCHSHPGLEVTLVLAGGYRDDDDNRYARGDVSV